MSRARLFEGRGFTLLELLVAMSILSVIMVALVSAMRTMAQTEERLDRRVSWLDQSRVLHLFLGQTLARVSSAKVNDPANPGRKVIAFQARSDALSWVGILPARPDVGGRHFFRLAVENTGDRRDMVLRIAPWQPDLMQPNWSTSEARVLLSGLTEFTIEAQGDPGGNAGPSWPKGWQAGWPVANVLPQRVRLHARNQNGDVLTWIIPLYAIAQTDATLNVLTVGGGS